MAVCYGACRRRRAANASAAAVQAADGDSSSDSEHEEDDNSSSSDSEGSWWWACASCHGSKDRRANMAMHVQAPVVDVHSDDAEAAQQLTDWTTNLGLLLTLPPGGALQLAVLRCGVRYAHRLLGYLHALSAADKDFPPLLRGPLVCWDEAAVEGCDAEELAQALDSLVTYLRSNNPVVQRYMTMAERQWGTEQVSDLLRSEGMGAMLHC